MRSSKTIHVISAHAEGEVGDVIVGGVAPPPGDTVWDQRSFIASDQTLRNFVLNEPRGGVFRHVNLLVPPQHPEADAAFIIMEPEDTPPMSGSNSICVSTVLLDSGILPMQEPETHLTLEAPGGLVRVRAECRNGKAERIYVQNVPSFADKLDAKVEVEGIGTLRVDTAFGGDSFVIVDAADLGFALTPDEGADLARTGARITDAANEQLGFSHPTKDWNHISFCQIAGPLERQGDILTGRNTVAIKPGKLDRSPLRYRRVGPDGGSAGQRADAGNRSLSCALGHRQRVPLSHRWPVRPERAGHDHTGNLGARMDHRHASAHAGPG